MPTQKQATLFPAPGHGEQDDDSEDRREALPAEPDIASQLRDAQRREHEANARADRERARMDEFIQRSSETQRRSPDRIDPNTVPDPSVDPDAFARHQSALYAQQQRDFEERLDTQRTEMETRQFLSEAWSEFQRRYPDYAGYRDLASAAFSSINNGSKYTDVTELIESVKDKMESMTNGTISGGKNQGAANRTAGVVGGAPAVRVQKSQSPDHDRRPVSLVDAVFKSQEAAGLL